MLQGKDGSLTVWNHKGDELERLLLNGICDFIAWREQKATSI